MFPPILTEYGVTPNPMDFGQTFADLYKAVWGLDEQIRKATDTDDTEKVVHPWDVKATGDKSAKKIANDLLENSMTASNAAIEKNQNVALHLREAMSNVQAYFSSEVTYYRHRHGDGGKKVTGNTDKMRADRKELVEFARKLWDTFPTLASDEKVTAVAKFEDGKLSLPSIRGRASQTGDSDVPTGRYAGYYKTVWNVDGNEFPVGTDPREVLRTVYVGTERIGKKLSSDLFDLLDK